MVIRFLNPNYHVILIHYPLALLGVGLLIEIFSFLWRTSTVRLAGHWMMLIGALATLPAMTTGLFAKWDVLSNGGANSGTWADVKLSAGLSALQWHMLNQHVVLTSIGAAVAAVGAIIWLGSETSFPGHIGRLVLLMFLVAMGLMVAGAYNAGEMVYRTQIATRSQDQSDKMLADWHTETNQADPKERFQRRLEFYVDTLQAHVIGAGVVFALVAAAMGLSWQKSSQVRLPRPKETEEEPEPPVYAPAGRFWLVTALAGAATLAVGWYVTAHDLQWPLWDVRAIFKSQIWEPFRKDSANSSRMLLHFVFGSAIIVLAVLLIAISRFGSRRRFLIGLLSLLLIAIVMGQITVGTLLMYDGDSGPAFRFSPPTGATASVVDH
jgi:uncharacterized membrane protein